MLQAASPELRGATGIPTRIILTTTDGAHGWFADLSDSRRHYLLWSGAQFEPPDDASGEWKISLPLRICGEASAVMLLNKRAINRLLAQAERAYELDQGPRVALGWQWSRSPEMALFDVKRGLLHSETVYPDWIQATLSLVCLVGGRGRPVTVPTSDILTAFDPVFVLPAPVRGDMPALARVTVNDMAGAGVGLTINRVRLVSFGAPYIADPATAWDPRVDLAPDAFNAGTDHVNAGAFGGHEARISPTTTEYQRVAFGFAPATGYQHGMIDVFGLVTDDSVALATPTAPTLTLKNTLGASATAKDAGGTSVSTVTVNTGSGGVALFRVVMVWVGGSTVSTTTPGYTAGPSIAAGGAATVQVYYGVTTTAAFTLTTAAPTVLYAIGSAFAGDFDPTLLDLPFPFTSGNRSTDGIVASDVTSPDVAPYLALGIGYATPHTPDPAKVRGEAGTVGNMNYLGQVNDPGAGETGGLMLSGNIFSTDIGCQAAADVGTDTTGWWFYRMAFASLVSAVQQLPIGSFGVQVTALDLDGAESLPSAVATLATTKAGQALSANWPDVTGAAAYRVYVTFSGVSYAFQTPDATSSLTITTLDTGTLATPPTEATITCAQYKLSVGGTTDMAPRLVAEVQGTRGRSKRELLSFGAVHVARRREDDSRSDYAFYVDVRHPWRAATVDLDALIILPHDAPQTLLEYRAHDLNVPSQLQIDTRRDGRAQARLLDGVNNEIAALHDTGALYLEHGAGVVIVIPEVNDGTGELVYDLAAEFTVDVVYVPRYADFTGYA